MTTKLLGLLSLRIIRRRRPTLRAMPHDAQNLAHVRETRHLDMVVSSTKNTSCYLQRFPDTKGSAQESRPTGENVPELGQAHDLLALHV